MLTGWYGMQVGQYILNSGDRRYAEPGALTFRLNERTAFPHDYHTIIQSVVDNFKRSDFCLFPCEPNWVYPICNMYGMSASRGTTDSMGRRTSRTSCRGGSDAREGVHRREGFAVRPSLVLDGPRDALLLRRSGVCVLRQRVLAGARPALVGDRPQGDSSFFIAKDAEGKPRLTLPPRGDLVHRQDRSG